MVFFRSTHKSPGILPWGAPTGYGVDPHLTAGCGSEWWLDNACCLVALLPQKVIDSISGGTHWFTETTALTLSWWHAQATLARRTSYESWIIFNISSICFLIFKGHLSFDSMTFTIQYGSQYSSMGWDKGIFCLVISINEYFFMTNGMRLDLLIYMKCLSDDGM